MRSSLTKFDLHKNYPHLLELGIIGALLIFIIAAKLNVADRGTGPNTFALPDEPPIVLPPVTQQKKTPVSPVLAPVPTEIPNDDPIDPPKIDFSDFDNAYSNTLSILPETYKKEEDEILEIVEFKPRMKGGIQALYKKINYPDMARRAAIEGQVVVQFVINEKGEVMNPEIIRGIGAGCDDEVLRAIRLQKFTPGIQNGNLVKVRMKITVNFRLK